jgi:hypothetical protein
MCFCDAECVPRHSGPSSNDEPNAAISSHSHAAASPERGSPLVSPVTAPRSQVQDCGDSVLPAVQRLNVPPSTPQDHAAATTYPSVAESPRASPIDDACCHAHLHQLKQSSGGRSSGLAVPMVSNNLQVVCSVVPIGRDYSKTSTTGAELLFPVV